MSFFEELKRRNVFRVAVAYLAFAWLIVQVASIVLPVFGASQLALKALIVAFTIGFPIVLVCTWVYELTPEGVKRTEDVSDEDRRRIRTGRRLDFVIIGVLSLALIAVVVDQYILRAGTRYDTLAVLPFENLSGDPEQEYFADGMTDALITNLGKIGALDVISRTSVMRFKHTDLSLPQIATALGATVIVEASAQRVGDRVQVTARLVDGATDRQLWGDTFEEGFSDVLRLQSRLAQAIARGVRATITPDEETRLAARGPVDPAAYDAYLRGLEHLYRLAPQELDVAQSYFEQSQRLDPESALGYAGLALTWAYRAQVNVAPATEAAPLVRGNAERAAAIDEDLASAQLALSVAAYLAWDLTDADTHVRRAIELEPSNAEARFGLATYRVIAGDSPEALAQIDEAVRLDPINPLYKMFRGVVLMSARQYDASIDAYHEALEAAPNLAVAWLNLTSSLQLAGRLDEATDAERQWLNTTKDEEGSSAFEAGLAAGGYAEGMRNVAQVLGRRALSTGVGTTNVWRHYGRAGDWEKVVEWWERAFEQRDPNALWVRMPELDAVRDDPRVHSRITQIGM